MIANCNHLTDENWHEWKEHMKRLFTNCDITGYVHGDIKQPDEYADGRPYYQALPSDAAGYDFSRLMLEPTQVLIQAEPWLAKLILPASTST